MAAKLKKGDKVVVIAGASKNKRGEIIKVMPKEGRALVQGVNMVKRHQRPTQANPEGGIIMKEAPIQLSKLALVDPKEDVATRVGFRVLEDGSKVRFAKKSGEVLDG